MDIDIDSLPVRLKQMDETAFLEFSAEFGPRLRRYFIRLGSCPADAEALAVTCQTDITLKADRFENRGPGMFERWVFTLARNAWLDQRKGSARALTWDVADPGKVEGDPELEEAVAKALDELDELERKIVTARHFEDGPTFAEIGRRVGLDEGTTRVRFHRALRKLSKKLAAFASRGGASRAAFLHEVDEHGS